MTTTSTYPLTTPTGYPTATSQTCAGLVNVAIDMITQWVAQQTSTGVTPATFAWQPYDPCSATGCYGGTFDVLSQVDALTCANLLYTTFTTATTQQYTEPSGFVATSTDGTQAFLVYHGSVTKQDLAADGMYKMTPYPNGGNVETGFYTVFNGISGLAAMLQGLPSSVTTVCIAGHSLGAAVGTLSLPVVLASVSGLSPSNVTCCLSGSPKVGDQAFANYIEGLGGYFLRIVNTNDPVPKTPPWESGPYVAIGTNVASFSPPTYGGTGGVNNHDHCCSYSYAIFNPANTQNLNFSTCQSTVSSDTYPPTTSV